MFDFCKRVCCIAIMAPALTDATGQGKINLSESHLSIAGVQPLITSENHPKEDQATKKRTQISYDSRGVIDCHTLKTKGHRIYLNSRTRGHQNTLRKRHINNSSAFQQEFIKSINILDRMNQPTPSNGDQIPDKSTDTVKLAPTSFPGNSTVFLESVNLLKNGTKNGKVNPLELNKENNLHNKNGCLLSSHENRQQTTSISAHNVNLNENSSSLPSGSTKQNMVPVQKVKTNQDSVVPSGLSVNDISENLNTCTNDNKKNLQYFEKLSAIVENSSAMDVRLEASGVSAQLERRLEFFLRRIRRLQSKHIEKHVRNQISMCLEHQQKNLHSLAKSLSSGDSFETNHDLNINILNKSLSTAALVNLVQQAQKQAVQQNSGNEHNTRFKETTYMLNLDKKTRKECQKVSEIFDMNLRNVQSTLDSDATESSSGGESGDELEDVSSGHGRKLQKPIQRQAEWKWSSERAAMASRWTWLQAQVSDLEYRIRQQSDIYKQIRHSKGSIVLGDPPSPPDLMRKKTSDRDGKVLLSEKHSVISPCNVSTVLSNLDRQASKLNKSLGNLLTPSPLHSTNNSRSSSPAGHTNGLQESPFVTDSTNVVHSENKSSTSYSPLVVDDSSCQAARCRPLCSYRKRKLLWSTSVNQSLRTANRLSSVNCQCYPPVTSCCMCGGRYDNKQTIEADIMPYNEIISHLDTAYHPVLSFSYDTPLYLKFVSLIQTGEWMAKLKTVNANKSCNNKRKCKANSFNDNRTKIRKSIAAALIQSAKIRNKYESKSLKRQCSALRRKIKKNLTSDYKRRRVTKLAIASLKRKACRESSSGNKDTAMLKELRAESLRKKRGESAYDINNIVIPYSIAASTRVEKLQYKEIATPEWRDISDEMVDDIEEDTENEDLSDESFLIRHQKCEAEERKRFASFIQFPVRRRFKTDSLDSVVDYKIPDVTSHPLPQDDTPISPNLDDSFSSSISHKQFHSRRDSLSLGSSFDEGKELDLKETVEPWATRCFPISVSEYDEMTSVQQYIPEKQPFRPPQPSISATQSEKTDSVSNISSRPSTPSSVTNSVMDEEEEDSEDPNDPEWTNGATSKIEKMDY